MPSAVGKAVSAPRGSRTRSPYVVKACDECRRRKIKCNGGDPCRRCDRLSLKCLYRAKRQHNSHPESIDVATILAELNALRAENEALTSSSGQGSASSESPIPDSHRAPADPLSEIPSAEIYRLIDIYDKYLQLQYPLVDIDSIKDSASLLDRTGQHGRPQSVLGEADAACLKLLLASAIAVDDRGHGALPAELYESTRQYISGLSEAGRLDITALSAIGLVTAYYFVTDRVVAAWRNLGLAARIAIELGLHLQPKVEKLFPDPRQQAMARELFWSIYILDYCWSLHMGFAPTIKEVDLVIGIAEPDESRPYLRAMLDCTRIISRAWDKISPTVNQIHNISLRAAQERLEDVYREIREWQSSSAVNIYFYNQEDSWQTTCLKTFLYLRANELCIFLCRPILVTRNSLAENRGTLEFATTLAKDSISVLTDFHRNCSGMRVLPFVFNQFLGSALGSLFIAIIQEPHRYITREGDCRPPIMAAKALVEDLERSSFVPRKFYDTIREDFEFVASCRILGRDPEKRYDDDPMPTTQEEFTNALRYIEPLFGRMGHEM